MAQKTVNNIKKQHHGKGKQERAAYTDNNKNVYDYGGGRLPPYQQKNGIQFNQ
jgi:hypothetical protein